MKHQPPSHLDKSARQKWREIVVILEERGDVDAGTLDALAAYCVAWSRWTDAEAKISELGPIVKSPAGFPVANPYVGIAAAAQRQMRQWGGELRLTPKARGRKAEGGEESAVSRILRVMDQQEATA